MRTRLEQEVFIAQELMSSRLVGANELFDEAWRVDATRMTPEEEALWAEEALRLEAEQPVEV